MKQHLLKMYQSVLICLTLTIYVAVPAYAKAKNTDIEVTSDCLPGEPCALPKNQYDTGQLRSFWEQIDNPQQDGWNTEVFNSIAGKQLKIIGQMLVDSELLDTDHVSKIVTEKFTTEGLLPIHSDKLEVDNDIKIKRTFSIQSSGTKNIYEGTMGALSAFKHLAQSFAGATDQRFKFKIFRVSINDKEITTRQYFALSGQTPEGIIEQNATWDIQWSKEKETHPKISSIKLVDFEEVYVENRKEKLFIDVTASVLDKNKSYKDQLLHGYPEFLASIENLFEFNFIGTPGIATGDINNDGLDDVYICQEQGLPNLLYVQQEDGTLLDISKEAGVDWLENSRSALLLDFDNDGDQDIAVAIPGAVVLAQNNGTGTFVKVLSLPIGDDPMSMASADFDMDGDLDLYVTLYSPSRLIEKRSDSDSNSKADNFIYHDANNGPPNTLFRNDIIDNSWQFTNVTERVELNVNNSRFSFSAAWEDYDNDGDQDLYVANDYGRDNLYRNELIPTGKSVFVDVSDEAAIENSAGSMGITWGDYNRDGYMDAFINAMWSSAGNRVTFQNNFTTESKEVKKRIQHFAHGNTMLKNNGDGTFTDASDETGIEMGRWAWNSNFVDMNNDGWEDLIVSNGYLTGDEKGGDL